jgi:hypothetical protein
MRHRLVGLGIVAALVFTACSSAPPPVPQGTTLQPVGEAQPAPAASEDRATASAGSGLVGIWRGETLDIFGNPALVETVMQPNGRFSQTTYSSGDPIWIAGTYRVVDAGTIRFAIEDHTRQWCGPLGCQQLYLQEGETRFFEFADADTLITWGYQDPTRVVHRRVG